MRTRGDSIVLALTGDVMLGRGIDQILGHPGDPVLYESDASSALLYVELAERAHGPIPRAANPEYVWGDAIAELDRLAPDVRIINLETSASKAGRPEPKGINYRMSPANVDTLKAFNVDCCVLANNHVLDWGEPGLIETLDALDRAGIAVAGAGRNDTEARAPAILNVETKGRVQIFGRGAGSAGVSPGWAASGDRPGIGYLRALSADSAIELGVALAASRRPGDIAVASLHWGPNWGYRITHEEREFAHRLIDTAGFDIVHGHSSHHAKGIEIYRGKPILYGCGDFINDYEGISGYKAFRDDLGIVYIVEMVASTGELCQLRLVPFQIKKFRLNRAGDSDVAWLRDTLDRESRRFETRIGSGEAGELQARW